MEEVTEKEKNDSAVYLPHHAVVREDKETTKTRVVFNASCKGSNNASLNDQLLVGPQLQEDLRSVIMRWRMKRVSFVADIQKMYREILVTEDDANFQRILWRKDKDESLHEYRILRVTFGTASAPYLAVRTLMQVANDESKDFPAKVAQTIREDFYVDDLMSGSDTVEEAIELSNNISQLLTRGGFILQKWSSNNHEFIEQIQPSSRSTHAFTDKQDCVMKTLGLSWNNDTDQFQYNSNLLTLPKVVTKRSILADISRLYDPLGWLGAAIIPAKILIQKLWLERIGWDDEINDDLKKEWIKLRQSFEYLKEIKINRWILTDSVNLPNTTLHGFCDASKVAYAAIVYCRVVKEDGEICTSIVAAKTRVTPVKPVTVSRLELCGAVLLAKLLRML